jgi:predicted TPR repeat methyltransferase
MLIILYSVLPEADNIIIDLGCGTGYTFSTLKAIGHKGKVRGLVLAWRSSSLIFERPKHVYDDVMPCDIRYLPIRKELALPIGILEHLEKEECVKLLNELKRIRYDVVLLSPFERTLCTLN